MTPDHGTDSRYKNHACRCEPCAEAHARACKAWRLRTRYGRTDDGGRASVVPVRVPAGQAADHLAALRASGMPWADIVDATGLHRVHLGQIMRRRFPRIHRAVHAAILGVEPLADPDTVVDEVAVERVLAGAAPLDTLNRAERSAARVEAARRGWTASEITRRLATNGSRAKALVEEAAS